MNDAVDSLIIDLNDAADVAVAGHAEMADSGGAGGQHDLLSASRDDGEDSGRECS